MLWDLRGVVMLWVFKECSYALCLRGVVMLREFRDVVMLWVFKGWVFVMGI